MHTAISGDGGYLLVVLQNILRRPESIGEFLPNKLHRYRVLPNALAGSAFVTFALPERRRDIVFTYVETPCDVRTSPILPSSDDESTARREQIAGILVVVHTVIALVVGSNQINTDNNGDDKT